VEWWQSLGVGVLVGSVLGPLVRPWSRRVERLGRKLWREQPVIVHVEWDQAVIWAGQPPWVSFSYYFPGDPPTDAPPASGVDWSRWVERHNGFDLGLTMLRVTVTAQTDATVVMETPIVRGTTQDVPAGVGVVWPAPGGADISPRRYAIQLDSGSYPATVTFVEQDPGFDQPKLPPSWTLAAGEVEQLHIWASAEAGGMHEWTMQLPLLVDGRREFVDVDKDGRPFVTVGRRHGYRDLCWRSEQWIDPPDWATPR
jgi:hypothetical protein